MKIVITGSVTYDYLMTFPGSFKENILAEKLETISLSFLVETLVKRRGGVVPNIAYNLALLGGTPATL
jgi:adenosine kinase